MNRPRMNEGQPPSLEQLALEAFAQAPALYANGFINGLGATDAYLILQTNGRPTAVVNMSLPVAKTLAASLAEMIATYERESGASVPTLGDL